ncbi:carbohydrate kinase [Dictyobacter alpinus]|uniref:Carbohydrate kinase n=1 Tax=Dictyobacter alpinus TaxID=2014873 RepID=A0A402BE05_9CHLR|nr:rhamnulokinase family protein [Dictyobacter alpinus]GCE29623.1 carbohydrate kinase [Dictyobacter alpinus]
MKQRIVAAIDLGAESGRVMVAHFDGEHFQLDEIYRFANRSIVVNGHRFWNVLSLWDEMLAGLRKARQTYGTLDSIGIDTWAVDYGLVDEQRLLLGQVFQYRDHRTDRLMEEVCARIGRERLYARTGIQFLPFNTLYQLYAQRLMQPDQLHYAHRLLMIPDIFHSWLCGSLEGERTNASTTQCWDPLAGAWARDLLQEVEIPAHIFPEVVEAGSILGDVLPALRNDLGQARVIAPATHDTASAIVAAPVSGKEHWGYISSGTWSLVGMELAHPVLSEVACQANFTNEGGVFGTTRFLKNVMGLWLLQECQRQWAREGHRIDYETLFAEADGARPFQALIDPDDPRFLAPENMLTTINVYLLEHGQQALQTPAAFARCIMESLVVRYCDVFRQACQITGRDLTCISVLGGGARNTSMNQWLADALGLPVMAGPIEATASGNALMQLVGLGELHDLKQVRQIASHAPIQTFFPRADQHASWDEAAERLHTLQFR